MDKKYKEDQILLKDIKHVLKSINLSLLDLEFLSEIVRFSDNSAEILEKIKCRFIKNNVIIDIYNEVEKIKKIFEKKIKISKKQIKININNRNLPKNIKLESDLLNICIYNILSNSIKFSSNGIIDLNLIYNQETSKLIIAVADQGIGIKKENLGKIGLLFFKVENPNNFYGLGIGLFSVKLITQAINGNMRLISEYGKGTCVQLEFTLIQYHVKSVYGKNNNQKIYKIYIGNEENLSPALEGGIEPFSHSLISSYVNYLNSKYWSSSIFLAKNRMASKKKILSISNLNYFKQTYLSEIRSMN